MKATNKKRQKPTILGDVENSVNGQTGLTPMQEKAAMLLAAGGTLTGVAEQLGLNRSTLYKWQTIVTFQCFYNQQCSDNKANLKNGLFGLADAALEALRASLYSESEGIRLKAAMWLCERLEATAIGNTDVRAIIKQRHTQSSVIADWNRATLDESGYKAELKQLGLDATD